MKKIFTLTTMALTLSLTASAKYQLSLDDLPNGWGSSYDPATQTISYVADGWGGRGWGLTPFDAEKGTAGELFDMSAYDYLVVRTYPSTLKLNVAVEYTDGVTINDNKDGLKGIASASWAGEAGTTFFAVPLNKDYKYGLQVFIQNQQWQSAAPNNPEGCVRLIEAFLGTKAEYEEALASHVPYVDPKKSISLAELVSGWGNSTYDAATHTVTIGDDWSGKGWWLATWNGSANVGTDYSDYDKFVIEFAQPTATGGKVNVEYDGGTAATFFEFAEGATVAVVDLDPVGKKVVLQANIQGPAGAQFVLKEAYFCTADVAPEVPTDPTADVIIWNETHRFDTWDSFTIPADKFVDATAGDFVVFAISEAFELSSWPYGGQVHIKKSDWSDNWAANDNSANPSVPAGTTNAEVVFPMNIADGAMLADVKANGMLVQGMGLTVAKVLIRKAADSSVKGIVSTTSNNAAVYNLRGQRVGSQYRGIVISNGKKYLLK